MHLAKKMQHSSMLFLLITEVDSRACLDQLLYLSKQGKPSNTFALRESKAWELLQLFQSQINWWLWAELLMLFI